MSTIKTLVLVALCIGMHGTFFAQQSNANNQDTAQNSQLFYFGTAAKPTKGTAIKTPLLYTPSTGYGFDFGSVSNVKIASKGFYTDKPTYFSVAVPEGNYSVEVTIGSNEKATNVTIKAESRRLMLNQFSIKKGGQVTQTFNVNIRNPKIDATTNMGLKDREKDTFNWDDKLTLEFLGDANIQSIKITPVTTIPVIYLAGDSTVTDQDVEPWASWGQFITNYFNNGVVVANYAVSGSALSSFKSSNRLKKINSLIKPSDYLFVEFAHNDEKLKGPENTAWESYSKYLEEYVETARNKGAFPVLVTPTQRRTFNPDGTLKPTHGDFPDAMRAVAKKLNVPLIDITQMTTILYEAWGVEASKKALVHYPANTFPGQEKALEDNTHFNSFGANEIALCVIKGIRDLDLPLKKYITKETPAYDPAKPNYFSNWTVPMSARFEIAKPDGN
ncbi:Lysophospholipase L1 [Flavobacterium fluvii]|uniref:Lysophospholipase L1 n=1 Tax=Flavobacterium fluvii TaxID=468056 RepID=A0A1M5HEE9_9FLAO|nr:rhamnogalacturonan acetylesterase [Flavobacterium fluvii]SHG14202.1 Lysophospholipase L1 [Flavobacterium fluvii]